MIIAMQSAIAGLKAHQTKMDVVSNNIANVNTWGYKAKTTNFSDAMYKNYIQGSAGAQSVGNVGGTGTSQIGYGANVSSVSADFTTGSKYYTGNGSNIMIDGPAFLVVGTYNEEVGVKSDDIKNSGLYLSRVGILKSPDGYLVDDKGNYVYGYETNYQWVKGADNTWSLQTTVDTSKLVPLKFPDQVPNLKFQPDFTRAPFANGAAGPIDAANPDIVDVDGNKEGKMVELTVSSMTIQNDGSITVVNKKDNAVCNVGKFALATVENTAGLEQSSGYLYTFGPSVGDITISEQSAATGSILSGYLEQPNVDLATELSTMITTQRGYQANSKMITVSDEMLETLVNMKR